MQFERTGADDRDHNVLIPIDALAAHPPGQDTQPQKSPNLDAARGHLDLIWLTLAFGVLFAFRLAAWPLVDPDEGRYAEIPREMALTGDWVTPRIDGVKYFEKPPLVYWLVAASQKAFGHSELSIRLTPALFALAGVLLTYGAIRRIHGRKAGLLSAAVLGTSLFYFVMGRILTLDMVLAALMSATLFCFMMGVAEPAGRTRRMFFYGLYVSAALAVLTKGLVGALIPGAIFVIWLTVAKQWSRLRPLHLPSGLVIFSIIAVPWHLLVASANPEWAWFYFIREHLLRYTTAIHDRSEPWWFFLPIVWFGVFPWTGFIWPALKMAWRERSAPGYQAASLQYLAISAGFVLVFYSISNSKLSPYVLPAFPPVAALIGVGLSRALDEEPGFGWRGGLRVFSIVSALIAAGFAAVVLKPTLIHGSVVHTAEARPFLFGLVALLAAAAIQGWRTSLRGTPRHAIAILGATAVVMFMLLTYAAPPFLKPDTKPVAMVARREFKPGDEIFSYHDYFQDFPYYSRLLVGTVSSEGELAFGIAQERASGRFIDDAELARRWCGANRVFVIVSKRDAPKFFAANLPSVHTLVESDGHCLLSNR